MKVLCVHQNFPGQYLHLTRYLGSQSEHQVVFITQRQDVEIPGVRKITYKPRRMISPQVHHYLRESEAAVLNAQEVARVAIDLRNAGCVPRISAIYLRSIPPIWASVQPSGRSRSIRVDITLSSMSFMRVSIRVSP